MWFVVPRWGEFSEITKILQVNNLKAMQKTSVMLRGCCAVRRNVINLTYFTKVSTMISLKKRVENCSHSASKRTLLTCFPPKSCICTSCCAFGTLLRQPKRRMIHESSNCQRTIPNMQYAKRVYQHEKQRKVRNITVQRKNVSLSYVQGGIRNVVSLTISLYV